MPRRNYGTQEARRRNTMAFAEPEQSEYEILMTNGKKVKRIKVTGTSGVNAWNRAIRKGLQDDEQWWPIEVSNNDWSYSA